MADLYSSAEFDSAYYYRGNDLGANYTASKTTFRVWAPEADGVDLLLYASGDPLQDDLMNSFPMKPDTQGTWYLECSGNLKNVYYTYRVTRGSSTIEACDPYARAVGVNGERAMVVDLTSTNPEDWDHDHNPNSSFSITDSIIYELHIRDLSSDPSSGIQNKGKYLGLIETGTKTPSGLHTGLDHIKELGVTHVQLLPIYDFGSVDERHPEMQQYNWGYDPVHFNVPEGSYSSDPYHGEVRIRELKRAIKGLHDNGISVVMDVVYNHVYDAKSFCFNKIVPDYFSRTKDGIYSNGSGCGNDTASERVMVRKYIVDSVCYWADEYHIDGFRFDLVGLLDIDTVNLVVAQVRKSHPNVIFYGEGWNLPTHVTKKCQLATQNNANLTEGFGYFNDTIRDSLRGSVFLAEALGFVTGASEPEDTLIACFKGLPHWCCDPKQAINYVSCHDNNTLLDRITLAVPDTGFENHVRMNKLAAVFYLCAQGVPFMQAGEEMLRSKPDPAGGFVENSYRSCDEINSIKWDCLDHQIYHDTFCYYKGLISFRKMHPVLRMHSVYDILSNLIPIPSDHPQVCSFQLDGNIPNEPSDKLLFVFNASSDSYIFNLPEGRWDVFIDQTSAGVKPLYCVQKKVSVAPISAMVLIKRS